jgi:hypothetical protein
VVYGAAISTGLALVLAAATPQKGNPFLPKAIEQLRDLDESAALKTLEQARAWPQNTRAELAQVHLYTGLAQAGLVRADEAIASFRTALVLDPELRLPEGASPRVREWWVSAGGRVDDAAAQPPEPGPSMAAASSRSSETPPPVSSRKLRWLGVTLAGASLLGVGIGAVFGGRAASLAGQANREPRIVLAEPTYASAVGNALGANVLFVVGAVLSVGAVVLWVVDLL